MHQWRTGPRVWHTWGRKRASTWAAMEWRQAGDLVYSASAFSADKVQNTLPQNMAPWHTEHFKLKKLDGWQVQNGLWPFVSPWKPSLRLVRGGFWEEKNLLSLKMEGAERTLNEQALLSVPSVLPWAHTPSHSPVTFDSSSNPVQTCKGLRISLSHFVTKVFVSRKTCIEEIRTLFSC